MSSRQNRCDMEVEVMRSHENRYGIQLEAFTINALINKETLKKIGAMRLLGRAAFGYLGWTGFDPEGQVINTLCSVCSV